MNRYIFCGVLFVCIFLVISPIEMFFKLENVKSNNITEINKEIPMKKDEIIEVYIGGAVENEGYFETSYFSTYKEIYLKANPKSNAVLKNLNKFITFDELIWLENEKFRLIVYVNYYENGMEKFVANIEYCDIEKLLNLGIDYNIANKIVENRKFYSYTSKDDLLNFNILTLDEYEKIKYKIYFYKEGV